MIESRAGRFVALALVLLAIFSAPLVRSNLVRLVSSPGYDDSALVTIDRDTVHHNSGFGTVRPYVMDLWRKQARTLVTIAPLERWTSPEGVHTERVSEGLFPLTGVQPWRGRLLHFTPEREAVVSYEWAGGDPSWIGRTVTLGYHPYRITGVMPPRFQLLSRKSQVWIALPPDARNLEFAGKLRPGATPSDAALELRGISQKARHWGTRNLEVVTLRHNRQTDFLFAWSVLRWNLLFVLCLCARGWVNYLRSGKREVLQKQQARFLGFLFLKTALVLAPLLLVWIVFVDPAVQQYLSGMSGWSVPVFFWLYLLAAWGLTFWSLDDQRHRCRACLEPLRMPVNRGSWSSLVLNRPATESICIYGHGTLYVPGTSLLNLDSVNWTANRDMWQQLAV